MDTKDKNLEYSQGFMSPDSTVRPPLPDALGTSDGMMMATTTGDRMTPTEIEPEEKSPTPFQESLRRLRRDKRAMVSLVVIALFVIIPLIGHDHNTEQVRDNMFKDDLGIATTNSTRRLNELLLLTCNV